MFKWRNKWQYDYETNKNNKSCANYTDLIFVYIQFIKLFIFSDVNFVFETEANTIAPIKNVFEASKTIYRYGIIGLPFRIKNNNGGMIRASN